MRFVRRTVFMLGFSLLPLSAYFLVNNHFKTISNNNYVNELGGNGIYEFGAAFWNNEIDYHQFYRQRNDTANFKHRSRRSRRLSVRRGRCINPNDIQIA